MRWVATIAIAANAALWPTISGGATDGLYAFLVLLGWVFLGKRWLSVLMIGLAVASRQQAWFYLLFYAVLVERTYGWRELLWRLGMIGGVFALLNAPYAVASPGPWLAGVLGPMRDPMFPRGTGTIALSIYGEGSLPLGPRWLYGSMEIASLLASLLYYRRICRVHPGVGLVLAPLALFFAWRSLYSYFLPITLLALYPALVGVRSPTALVDLPGEDDRAQRGEQPVVAA